jgi:hypothetical protein
MPATPMDEVPGSTGNDVVTDYQFDNLFDGQPLDVKAYLNTPGNMGDTTQVIINWQTAAAPWAGTKQYATDYLGNWDVIYPDLAGQ